jgi:heme a synthase
LAILQMSLGVLNVFLLAPIWLQLLHLLVADAVWIALILLGVTVLAERTAGRVAAHAA